MKATLPAAVLLLIASVSCTGSPGKEGPASKADVTRYQELTAQVQSAAVDYHSQMMGQTEMDATMCQYVHDQYYERTWPWVFELHQNANGMDETMHAYGGIDGDWACVSESMWEELEHHHSVACTSSGFSENLAEVQRHVELMTSYGAHLQDRCDDMMAALEGSTPDWGPMMTTCQDESTRDACDETHDGMKHGGMMHDGMMHGQTSDDDCE